MSILPGAELSGDSYLAGNPIHEGAFRIEAPNEDCIGQITYSGPNVMLGYAESPSDLGWRTAFGELPTGDFGRLTVVDSHDPDLRSLGDSHRVWPASLSLGREVGHGPFR